MDVQTIYLAGGCFWGMQKFIDQFEGRLKQKPDMPTDLMLLPVTRMSAMTVAMLKQSGDL